MNKRPSYHDSNVQIGQRIHLQRVLRKMTQEKVAEAINVTAKYFGQIERGERTLTFFIAEQLCLLFHVTYDYLYLGIERSELSLLTDKDSAAPDAPPSARTSLLNLVLASSDEECDGYLQLLVAANRLRKIPEDRVAYDHSVSVGSRKSKKKP